MEVKQSFTVISPENRGGGGGGCNSEQGVTARQYGMYARTVDYISYTHHVGPCTPPLQCQFPYDM